MSALTSGQARDRLAIGFALDHLWSETMGLSQGDSKEKPLRLVAEILEREQVPYALIGGVAVQLHTAEPRSTLDIDFAVPHYSDVPAAALISAGFEHTGRHRHRDNWRAAGSGPLKQRTAIQFSAEDRGINDAVAHARIVDLDGGFRLRVATVIDLITLKLAAAEESQRRLSKREHDIADVLALLEEHPDIKSPELMKRVQTVRASFLTAQLDLKPKDGKTGEYPWPFCLSETAGAVRELYRDRATSREFHPSIPVHQFNVVGLNVARNLIGNRQKSPRRQNARKSGLVLFETFIRGN